MSYCRKWYSADLSVIGARLALLKFASVYIAQEFVDASLVGSGIGDADTGIAGVCFAGGMQKGASAVAAAGNSPIIALYISSSFPDPLMAALLSSPTVSRFVDPSDSNPPRNLNGGGCLASWDRT